MISNEKNLKYKVLDLAEIYNFHTTFISIHVHKKIVIFKKRVDPYLRWKFESTSETATVHLQYWRWEYLPQFERAVILNDNILPPVPYYKSFSTATRSPKHNFDFSFL
jgi:hypothetical protein